MMLSKLEKLETRDASTSLGMTQRKLAKDKPRKL